MEEELKQPLQQDKREKPVLEFFIKTLNGMAFGLFATLIIGTIFGAIGKLFALGNDPFCQFMLSLLGDGTPSKLGISWVLECLTGAGIGVGIALSMKFDPLKVIVLGAIGEATAALSLTTKFPVNFITPNPSFQIGDPLTIYIVCILMVLFFKFVLKKKTPVDILIVPLLGLIIGGALALGVRYPLIYVTYGVQFVIEKATYTVPALMGIIIAVLMGMALTAPISSAAIAAMIFTPLAGATLPTGLAIASGAAVVGCCTQMIGFAVQSRKDNPIGMVISIGIGTSMLQFKNILRKPVIWLPTILTSAILGPIATCCLSLVCEGSAAGMGTAGLVGIIGTISSMGNVWQMYVGVFVLELVAPAVLVFIFDLIFRKLGWIKPGDLKV